MYIQFVNINFALAAFKLFCFKDPEEYSTTITGNKYLMEVHFLFSQILGNCAVKTARISRRE